MQNPLPKVFSAVLLLFIGSLTNGLATPQANFSSSASLMSESSPYHPANLRRHYEQAAADKAAGQKFYDLLANYKDNNALVLAYKGAAEAIRARDASMFNKLTYVQDAARTFEQAVRLDPDNGRVVEKSWAK